MESYKSEDKCDSGHRHVMGEKMRQVGLQTRQMRIESERILKDIVDKADPKRRETKAWRKIGTDSTRPGRGGGGEAEMYHTNTARNERSQLLEDWTDQVSELRRINPRADHTNHCTAFSKSNPYYGSRNFWDGDVGCSSSPYCGCTDEAFRYCGRETRPLPEPPPHHRFHPEETSATDHLRRRLETVLKSLKLREEEDESKNDRRAKEMSSDGEMSAGKQTITGISNGRRSGNNGEDSAWISKAGSSRNSRTESRQGSRPESTQGSRPEARQGSRPEARQGSRPESRPGSRPEARQDSRPEARQGSRPESRQGSRPGSRQGSRHGLKPESRQGSRPESRPGSTKSFKSDDDGLRKDADIDDEDEVLQTPRESFDSKLPMEDIMFPDGGNGWRNEGLEEKEGLRFTDNLREELMANIPKMGLRRNDEKQNQPIARDGEKGTDKSPIAMVRDNKQMDNKSNTGAENDEMDKNPNTGRLRQKPMEKKSNAATEAETKQSRATTKSRNISPTSQIKQEEKERQIAVSRTVAPTENPTKTAPRTTLPRTLAPTENPTKIAPRPTLPTKTATESFQVKSKRSAGRINTEGPTTRSITASTKSAATRKARSATKTATTTSRKKGRSKSRNKSHDFLENSLQLDTISEEEGFGSSSSNNNRSSNSRDEDSNKRERTEIYGYDSDGEDDGDDDGEDDGDDDYDNYDDDENNIDKEERNGEGKRLTSVLNDGLLSSPLDGRQMASNNEITGRDLPPPSAFFKTEYKTPERQSESYTKNAHKEASYSISPSNTSAQKTFKTGNISKQNRKSNRRPIICPPTELESLVHILQDKELSASVDAFNSSTAFSEPCQIRIRSKGEDFYVHRFVFDLHGRMRSFEGCDADARILVDLKKPVDNRALVKAIEFMYTLELQIESEGGEKVGGRDAEAEAELTDRLLRRWGDLMVVADVFCIETVNRACLQFAEIHLLKKAETALSLWCLLCARRTAERTRSADENDEKREVNVEGFDSRSRARERRLEERVLSVLSRRFDEVLEDERFLNFDAAKVADFLRSISGTKERERPESRRKGRGGRGGGKSTTEELVKDAIVSWVRFRRSQRQNYATALINEANLNKRHLRKEILDLISL